MDKYLEKRKDEAEVKKLIPKDKFDDSHIGDLYALSDEEIKPIIYDLLLWLQDYNWPVAKPVSRVLLKREKLVMPYLIEILQGEDLDWVYFILIGLVRDFTNEGKLALKPVLEKLSTIDIKNEAYEISREESIDILSSIK